VKPRILVTGSRYWRDRAAVRAGLDEAYRRWGPFVLVHGDCRDRRTGKPVGADRWADEWAVDHAAVGIEVERHSADWDRHGDAAGPIRNAEMVARDALVCLAWPTRYSRGTKGCMRLADEAGIPIVNLGER
jgi:hypothetical protein